ncbi:MAG: hypothetical protein ACRC75_03950, partial [Olsenella sp.]
TIAATAYASEMFRYLFMCLAPLGEHLLDSASFDSTLGPAPVGLSSAISVTRRRGSIISPA